MFKILIPSLLLVHVALSYDCPERQLSGTSGTIYAGDQTSGTGNCNKEVIKVKFGRSMAVKLTWEHFNVGGDMPYCSAGNVKIETG